MDWAGSEPTDVSLFVPDLTGGGAERIMLNLASGMAARGVRVDLVLLRATGPYLEEVPKSVRVVDLGTKRASASIPALARYVRQSSTGVVISALHHANLAAIVATRMFRLRTAVIPTIHNTYSVEQRARQRLKHRIERTLVPLCYRMADEIVAVSDATADDFAEATGIARARITAIYNPVVTQDMWRKANEPVAHAWFSDDTAPVVIGVGRLSPQKDFTTLLRAFALVRETRRARLVILGEGEERSHLMRLAAELGVQSDIDLPGFVDNPYPMLKRADAFVLSSRWEGLPTALIEALALGTPLVATDCPSGPREILRDGAYGALVSVGDHPALARAIDAALVAPPPQPPEEAWHRYTMDAAVAAYLDIAEVDGHA